VQALYKRVCEYMELDDRVEVLNNRLMVRCPQYESRFIGVLLHKALSKRPISSMSWHICFKSSSSRAPGLVTHACFLDRWAGCPQVLQEMLDMLRDHSNNAHSARLEWCAEVLCFLSHDLPSVPTLGVGGHLSAL